MKLIKFRAWLKDEKKMIDVKAIDFDEDGDVFSVNYPEGKSYCGYDRDNIELMQYTGLKDKNGVKIFEGDIVRYTHRLKGYTSTYSTRTKVVKFEDCCFKPVDDVNGFGFEVIGNIYENPELLGD